MAQSGSNKKVANSLVALSSAAVMAVYAAGYTRTRSAAERFEAQAAERRPAIPGPAQSGAVAAEAGRPSPETEPGPAKSAVPSLPSPRTESQLNPVVATVAEPAKADEPAAVPVPSPVETPALPSMPAAAAPELEAAPVPLPVAALPIASPPPPVVPSAPPAPVWKDGTYYGWGSSRHGDIQAAVVIQAGRIASATIADCRTRYSCSVISRLPPEVAQRQSPEVDYVSGATQSTNAFYYAVVEALGKAK